MPRTSPKLAEATERLLQALGARVRSARLAAGLSVSALAQQAGITRTTYYRVEAGDGRVSLASYAMILQLLGLEQGLSALATGIARSGKAGLQAPIALAASSPDSPRAAGTRASEQVPLSQPGLEPGQLP